MGRKRKKIIGGPRGKKEESLKKVSEVKLNLKKI